jgi:E3 ubiquitin-protein ligase UBR3
MYKVKQFDTSSVCGLVWNVNYVAYRCRTCALSPCMSICAECFKNGDHQGHDFNMFRSGAGGACDCGDECVMSSKGFCKSHSTDNSVVQNGPPGELIKCCEVILSNLLYRLLQHFRTLYIVGSNFFVIYLYYKYNDK